MTVSKRVPPLQVILLVLILFSWGLLYLSVELPDRHVLRKDLKRISLFEQRTFDARALEANRRKIYQKSCSDCWSMMKKSFNSRTEINKTFGWKDSDIFYLFAIKSTLTSVRIRLKMAEKVARVNLKKVKDIEMKVEELKSKMVEIEKYVGISSSQFIDVKTRGYTLNVNDRSSNISKDNENNQSSSEILSKRSFVPSLISVIVDGRKCDINLLLKTKSDLYPQVIFHAAINLTTSLDVDFTSKENIFIHELTKNISSGAVHNMLLKHITTPYTFVATDLRYFSENIKFLKLISLLKTNDIWAVSGSTLTPDKKWRNGCLQSSFKNYQLTFYRKNIAWIEECLTCYILEGPFIAITPILKILGWNELLEGKASMFDLFVRAFHFHSFMAASCIDSIFHILSDNESTDRNSVVALANLHRLKEISLPGSKSVTLNCMEMEDICHERGEIVSPCCLHELVSMIKFFLETCEAHRLFCELQEGSLLGAVKFNSVLPWDKDADITFHTSNFSALMNLVPVFADAGYTLKLTDNRWCCVNGSEAGGEGKLISDHWIVELYSQHAMDSEEFVRNRLTPTRVELDGSWVLSPANPGEFVRNRYGRNIYRHAEHWIDLGKMSGWEEYEPNIFGPCLVEGHHSCLDLNPTDGSLHFQLPCV